MCLKCGSSFQNMIHNHPENLAKMFISSLCTEPGRSRVGSQFHRFRVYKGNTFVNMALALSELESQRNILKFQKKYLINVSIEILLLKHNESDFMGYQYHYIISIK